MLSGLQAQFLLFRYIKLSKSYLAIDRRQDKVSESQRSHGGREGLV